MGKIHRILNAVNGLSQEELRQISDAVMQMLSRSNGVYNASVEVVEKCRKCGDSKIVKFGKDKNGKQRYRCKCCGATFTATSYSTVSRTRHSEDVWKNYIHLLLKGASLEECAYRCCISVRTAFIWRHKILNTLQNDQDNRVMAGIIEADEKYFPVSYKGNHSNSKRFVMPRKAFKRGSDNRSNNSPKACVMCAVERNGQCYGEVLGIGQPTTKMIDHAFRDRIVPDSILLADGALAMKNYFAKKTDVELVRLQSTTTGNHHGGPPEIRGVYHIQTVNNLHSRLDRFLRRYNGVSTKYLNHYIGLFAWIENHKQAKECMEKSLMKYIAEKSTYIQAENLFCRDAIPSVA